jgi:hypothetical protein
LYFSFSALSSSVSPPGGVFGASSPAGVDSRC